MVEHPVQLGEQGAGPDRADRHLHAEHPLGRQDDAQLVGERREPVVPVGQHDDLPVVAHLEELLGAAVHVADDRLGGQDALAVEGEPQPQHPVRGGVLRADVEHHVLGGRGRARAADLGRPGAETDGPLDRPTGAHAGRVCHRLATTPPPCAGGAAARSQRPGRLASAA